MRRSLPLLAASISENARLKPVQMFQRHTCEVLGVPGGRPLNSFQPGADVVDEGHPGASRVVVFPGNQVRQVNDELLEHRKICHHRIERWFGHFVSFFRFSRPDLVRACGPP